MNLSPYELGHAVGGVVLFTLIVLFLYWAIMRSKHTDREGKRLMSRLGLIAFLIIAISMALPLIVALIFAPSLGKPHWMKVVSREGRYVVNMPEEPKKEMSTLATPAGPAKSYSIGVDRGEDGVSYIVRCTDFCAEIKGSPLDALKEARDNVIIQMGGTLLDSNNITIDSYPGIDFWYRDPKIGKNHIRFYFAKGRLYYLWAGPVNTKKAVDESAIFFNSFALVP